MIRMQLRAKTVCVALGLLLASQGYSKEGNKKLQGKALNGISLRTETDSLVQLRSVTGTKASIFIFLSPECPICQQCTRELQLLFERFAASGIAFYGVSSGTFYSNEEIRIFHSTYKLGFPILSDDRYIVAHQLGATITPEVFVVDSLGNTLYSGAIDNAYRAPGKKNARTTEHYLNSALTAIADGKDIVIKRTTPVGCLIETLKTKR